MGIFGYKNDSIEYKKIEDYKKKMSSLLFSDCFISKKMYMHLYNDLKEITSKLSLMRKEGVLQNWSKNNKTDYKKLISLLDYYISTNDLVKEHNEKFVENHLISNREYLDGILYDDDPTIKLDKEQRCVVLRDEDYTLVVAGAGSGKTTTIEAKAKYLVDIKKVSPENILIVSFTRKATQELKERFSKLKIPCQIQTFHSIGNSIISGEEIDKHSIVEQGFLFDSVRRTLISKIDDEDFVRKTLLFFASYLTISFNEENQDLLFKTLAQDKFTTMKSDLKDALNEYEKKRTRDKVTLKEERVRSVEEARIANFLFINGVDYEYEPIYKYSINNSMKPYTPDFLIKQGGKEIYLEHFGISDTGLNNRFTPLELEDYKKHANDKVRLHKEHGTPLIYTFSKYEDGRSLIEHLKEKLVGAGISLEHKTDKEIYKRIAENAEDKYFNKLCQLISTFISRFKVDDFTLSKFDEWKTTLKDERSKIFVDICYSCYLEYERALKDTNSIDFQDMISNASRILDSYIEKGSKLPFEYIFIDEYQDISLQRFNLADKLSKCSNAKIVAVGDDWQSIYRFSGSRVNLFTDFEKFMGYADLLKITKTYRNSQELIDIAGGFVMKNDNQIKKELTSEKHISDPVILMSYDDSLKNDKNIDDKGPFYRMGYALMKSIEDIVLKNGDERTNILLIGRYGFDFRNLARLPEFFVFAGNKIVSNQFPKCRISFLTAHSSKGLGFSNVIILNGKDDILGFPSKIEDDPIMQLVIKDEEKMDYSEERRLFYVALTRTKNRVYIVTPQYSPSKFITEIKDSFTNVILRGEELTPLEKPNFRFKCPCCGYPLQRRANKNYRLRESTKLYICSNDPELCGFVTNDISGGKMSILKCPSCVDGYLIVKGTKESEGNKKRYFLGCTNYKSDGTGCNYIMNSSNYTEDVIEATKNMTSDFVDADKLIVFDMKIKDFVFAIYKTIKESMIIDNFKISLTSLVDVLTGNETNVILKWNLKSFFAYNTIDSKYRKRLFSSIRKMEEVGMVKIDKNDYGNVSIIKEKLEDVDCIKLYSLLDGR